jgi:PAS domain S-box-containing protein
MLVRAVPVRDETGQVVEFVGTLTDVEDTRRAEEETQTSAAIIDAIMASSPVGIAFLDREGRYVRINAAMAAFSGRQAEDHLGKAVGEIQPDLWKTEEPYFRQVIETGEAVTEHLVEGNASSPRHWLTSYFPVPGLSGEPVGVAVAALEVTSRVRAEQALAESEARLRALLEATPAMVVVADVGGRAIFTNRAWEEFTGHGAADGPPWVEQGYIHPDDLERAAIGWEQAVASGEGYDIDYRVRSKKGQYCWVAFQIRPVKDESGNVVSWTSAAIEIDERVRTQDALAASEARLRALIDATPAMVVMTDADGEVQIVSHEWTAFTGLDAEATRHWRELDTIHPEDAAATAKERGDGLRARTGYHLDYRLRRESGEYRWVSATVRPALNAEGRLLGWMFVGMDVDDRVRLRKRLEQVNADLRQLAESIPAIVITAPDDPAQPAFANRLWADYTGVPLEEVTAESIQRLIHRDDAAAVLQAWERTNGVREPYEVQFRLRRKDGAYRWFSWRTQPLFDAGQRYLGWITEGVEIDDQVRLREELEVTNEHLRVLAGAGDAISNAVDYEAAVEAAGSVLVPSFAAWCAVDIVQDEALVRKLALHAPEVAEDTARVLRESPPSLDNAADSLTGVVRSGEGLFLPRMPADLTILARSPEHRAAIEALGPNSSIAVPLRAVGGRTLGVLSLVRAGDQRPFSQQDFATVLELGRRLAAALDRSRLFSQVARALGNLRLLADAGLALSGSRELDEALEVATRLRGPADADWGSVDRLEGDTSRRASLALSSRVDEPMAEALRAVTVSSTDTSDVAARIVATGEPLFMPRIPADLGHLQSRAPGYREAAASLRAGSSIGVPLVAGETVFGVLGIMRVEGREPFDESDLALARELGRQLGGWLERGRLFSELRQALSAKDEFFGFVSHELKTAHDGRRGFRCALPALCRAGRGPAAGGRRPHPPRQPSPGADHRQHAHPCAQRAANGRRAGTGATRHRKRRRHPPPAASAPAGGGRCRVRPFARARACGLDRPRRGEPARTRRSTASPALLSAWRGNRWRDRGGPRVGPWARHQRGADARCLRAILPRRPERARDLRRRARAHRVPQADRTARRRSLAGAARRRGHGGGVPAPRNGHPRRLAARTKRVPGGHGRLSRRRRSTSPRVLQAASAYDAPVQDAAHCVRFTDT